MKIEMIETFNGKLAIHFGSENGNPQLFCIHGGMGLDSNSLIPFLDDLASVFDIVFIDLPGHGQSEASRNGQYHLQDLSRGVCEVVQKIKNSSVVGIFGHSLGGMVAIQALADEPLLFRFAILANTALNNAWQEYAGDAVRLLDQKKLEEVLQRYGDQPGIETLREVAIMYGPAYFPELSTSLAEKQMARFSYNDTANSFLSEQVYPEMNLSCEAREINTPTLVIAGSLDRIVPELCQKEFVENLQNVELVAVLDAGHFPFVTETKAFNKFVSNWWDNVRRRIA